MGFLSVILTFIGYVLVYASTAKQGRFATSPWAGVIADAYEDPNSPGNSPGIGIPGLDAGASNPLGTGIIRPGAATPRPRGTQLS